MLLADGNDYNIKKSMKQKLKHTRLFLSKDYSEKCKDLGDVL